MESCFAVGLQFRSIHSPGHCERFMEEAFIRVQAASGEEAEYRARTSAERGDIGFERSPDDDMKWAFIRVTRSMDVTEPVAATDPGRRTRLLAREAAAPKNRWDPASRVLGVGPDAMREIEGVVPLGLRCAELELVSYDGPQEVLRFVIGADITYESPRHGSQRLRYGLLTVEGATLHRAPSAFLGSSAPPTGSWFEWRGHRWLTSKQSPVESSARSFLHEFFLWDLGDSVFFSGQTARWTWSESLSRG